MKRRGLTHPRCYSVEIAAMQQEGFPLFLWRVGQNLQYLMNARGHSIRSLAKDANVSPNTLRHLCKGKNRFDPETIYKIAIALEVHPAVILNITLKDLHDFRLIDDKPCPFRKAEGCILYSSPDH